MADQLLGSFVWCELMTTDTAAADTFYKKIVGWKSVPFNPDGSYIVFNNPSGDGVAGMMKLPDEAKQMGAPPHWMMYIGTPDVDQTAMRIAQLGGRVVKQPIDLPGTGRFAVVQDPFGAMFATAWMPYAMVKDARSAAAIASANGAKIINGPMEVPGGDWIAQGMDPQGAMFSLHSLNPTSAKATVGKPTAQQAAPPKKKAAPAKKAKKAAKKTVAKKAKAKPVKKSAKRAKPAGKKSKKTAIKKVAKKKVAKKKAVKRAAKRKK